MERGVVVGIDETSESWAGLHWATQEALFRNRPLRIVHVYKGHQRPEERYAEDRRDLFDAAMGFARTRLGLGWVSGAFISGERVSALLAESAGADVLVVGSRRRLDPVASVLSSVSADLAWRASCPVLVVRGDRPWHRVVVGIRNVETSAGLLEFAFDEAYERCHGLSVVHCFAGSGLSEFDTERELSDHLAVFRQKYPEVTTTTDLVEHDPAETLIERSRHAGLVVVGSRAHLGGVPSASVSQQVLYGASCSFAVVREQ